MYILNVLKHIYIHKVLPLLSAFENQTEPNIMYFKIFFFYVKHTLKKIKLLKNNLILYNNLNSLKLQ